MTNGLTKISFVTGKGGVGKTSVAAGLAIKSSQCGKKTLLVELGHTKSFESLLKIPDLGHKPQDYKNQFSLAKWNVETCLKEYILSYLKIEKLYKVFFENQIMKILIDVAPALSDLAILGKITSDIVGFHEVLGFEQIIVDAYATGHMLSMLRSPKGISEIITSGPMGERSSKIDQVIRSSLCQYFIVTLPEALPALEAIELSDNLKNEFGIIPSLLINQVLDCPMSLDEIKGLLFKSGNHHSFINHLKFILENQKKHILELNNFFKVSKTIPKFINKNEPIELFNKIAEIL